MANKYMVKFRVKRRLGGHYFYRFDVDSVDSASKLCKTLRECSKVISHVEFDSASASTYADKINKRQLNAILERYYIG